MPHNGIIEYVKKIILELINKKAIRISCRSKKMDFEECRLVFKVVLECVSNLMNRFFRSAKLMIFFQI